jgi:hypothetical protein
MLTLEQAAYRVSDKAGDDREVFIDPATIMLICAILSCIFSAIRMWCAWRQANATIKQGEKIQEVCLKTPRRIRRKVKEIVQQELTEEQYAKYGNNMVSSILAAGAAATPEEITHMLNSTYENRFGEQETEL